MILITHHVNKTGINLPAVGAGALASTLGADTPPKLNPPVAGFVSPAGAGAPKLIPPAGLASPAGLLSSVLVGPKLNPPAGLASPVLLPKLNPDAAGAGAAGAGVFPKLNPPAAGAAGAAEVPPKLNPPLVAGFESPVEGAGAGVDAAPKLKPPVDAAGAAAPKLNAMVLLISLEMFLCFVEVRGVHGCRLPVGL